MLTTATELAALQQIAARAPRPLPCGTATEISLIDWAAALIGDTANVEAFAAWLADDTCMCWLPGVGG